MPFLNIIQAGDGEKVVAAAQRRGDAMAGLYHPGLRRTGHQLLHLLGPSPGGLYVDGKPSPLVKPVAALNAEMAKLGPALMELDSVARLSHRASALRDRGHSRRRPGAGGRPGQIRARPVRQIRSALERS